MSDDNVEIVRRILEAWERRQSPADLLDDRVEWVNAPEAVEPGTRRGRRAFEAAAASVTESFQDIRLDIEEMIPVGDQVLVLGTMVVRGRDSGAELRQPLGQLWTVRDGRAVRFEWFADRDQALTAIGAASGDADAAARPGGQAGAGSS
ncbi:MAG TPA: nuclear transport factor 2 family protein [Solirubrobacteraceae bacterium]|nr:nuclear transport factor 2 family protein [Solirubrobacteraceae bacterium]